MFLIPIVAMLSGAAIVIGVSFSPLGRGLAKRLAGKSEDDPKLQGLIEAQEERLLVAEHTIERLEERLEFTEKLLEERPAPPAIEAP